MLPCVSASPRLLLLLLLLLPTLCVKAERIRGDDGTFSRVPGPRVWSAVFKGWSAERRALCCLSSGCSSRVQRVVVIITLARLAPAAAAAAAVVLLDRVNNLVPIVHDLPVLAPVLVARVLDFGAAAQLLAHRDQCCAWAAHPAHRARRVVLRQQLLAHLALLPH
jgi:hypothetical protein